MGKIWSFQRRANQVAPVVEALEPNENYVEMRVEDVNLRNRQE